MPKPRRKSKPRPLPTSCPCGTGEPLAACCGPLLDGERSATTTEALVRSRYTAFRLGRGGYLWSTLHSQHEARLAGDQQRYEAAADASSSRSYLGLRILDRRQDADGDMGQVLFLARVQAGKLDRSFVEAASFAREDGQWRYIDGTTRPLRELGHAPGELTLDHWDCHGH